MKLLHKENSGQQEIAVYETDYLFGERGQFRLLQFPDGAVQGALDLNRPERIVFEYPRAMIHLMEENDPAFEDVFMIGHGIGTIAGYYPDKAFKVAELDETVARLSRLYFGYKRDNVLIGDGRQLLSKQAEQSLDFIILDAFTSQGTPRHLITAEFFRMAAGKLDAGGAILINIMGRSEQDWLVSSAFAALSAEFAYTQAFTLPTAESYELKNMILIGSHKHIRYHSGRMAGFVETTLVPGEIGYDSTS